MGAASASASAAASGGPLSAGPLGSTSAGGSLAGSMSSNISGGGGGGGGVSGLSSSSVSLGLTGTAAGGMLLSTAFEGQPPTPTPPLQRRLAKSFSVAPSSGQTKG